MSACPAEPEVNHDVGARSDSYAPRLSRRESVARADVHNFGPANQCLARSYATDPPVSKVADLLRNY